MTLFSSLPQRLISTLRSNGLFAFALEAAILFGALLAYERLVLEPGALAQATPSPYWIPVLVLAVQRGVAGGVAATVLATVLYLSAEMPARAMDQGVAEYRAELLSQPLMWLMVAIILGALRSRQAANARLQANELATARKQLDLFTTAIEDLTTRNTALERQIASGAATENAPWSFLETPGNRSALERAAPFLASAAGAESLGVFARNGDELVRIGGTGPDRIPAETSLFDAPASRPPAAPWAIPIAPSSSSVPTNEPITTALDTSGAVVVFELRDGVDPSAAHHHLARAITGLEQHIAGAASNTVALSQKAANEAADTLQRALP